MCETISQFARASQRSSVYLCKYTSNWGSTIAFVCVLRARASCVSVQDTTEFLSIPNGIRITKTSCFCSQNDDVGTLSFEDESVEML